MTKANKDGWIRWRGGKCPVAEGTIIDVRYRDGKISTGIPAMSHDVPDLVRCATDWGHKWKSSAEIMAYRLHKPEDARPTEADPRVVEAKSAPEIMEVSVGYQAIHVRPEFDAISMRDEVNEREEEITQYLKNIEENKERIAEIEKQLAEEGFALVEKPQQKQALPDMDDPKNWRVGDKFECINDDLDYIRPKGFITKITKIDGGVIWALDNDGRSSWGEVEKFKMRVKFHSRP